MFSKFLFFLKNGVSMNSNIFFFLSHNAVGLSVITITREGLFDEALIKPQDPSLNENLTPFGFKISFIS